jgi:hypothetical protein
MMTPRAAQHVTRRRRRRVMRLIRQSAILDHPVGYDVKVTWVLALLAGDDAGRISEDDLIAAHYDARLVALAEQMLAVAASGVE